MTKYGRRHPTAHLHAALRCRICRAQLDAASAVEGHGNPAPHDGDVSVCLSCGEISIFEVSDGKVIGLREANFVELAQIHRESAATLAAITKFRATRSGTKR